MPESVWDYPRPPALVPCERRVRVVLGGVTIVDSGRALRVLETSHPPAIYVPREDVLDGVLERVRMKRTFCEWKGVASYFDASAGGRTARAAAWTYRKPRERFAALRDFVSFYPGRVDGAWLDDEQVAPQRGSFYGGWITADVAGPFKG
jgi:uncharacterized protein (DUF427 family)